MSIVFYLFSNTMSAENRDGIGWYFIQIFDESCSFGPQVLDHVLVMDDFVPHIDWCTELLKGLFDGIDSANYTGAETSGLGEDDFHGGFSRSFGIYLSMSTIYLNRLRPHLCR
ncbi:hypothetical protein EMIT0P2_50110 [Pseudomonas sp. IT-P2]